MTGPYRARRRSGLVALGTAVAAVLLATLPPASAGPVTPSWATPDCEPGGRADAVAAGMARLERIDDDPDYTARQLRLIDRRLARALDAQRLSAGSARFAPSLRIPVHVHVIDGNRVTGPSRKRVLRQLAVLNAAYGGGQSSGGIDSGFRFYLASFERTRNQDWYTATMFDREDRQLRRTLHRGGPRMLNLYIAAPRDPHLGGRILGWSSVPWRTARSLPLDGVTVHQATLPGGRFRGYNHGDTAVHEVGHWLGLFHTFEGGCSQRNDRVTDTPAGADPSIGCPVGKDTCAAAGADPVRNFMDYSLDTCMNLFTPGQAGRMMDNWLAYRTP